MSQNSEGTNKLKALEKTHKPTAHKKPVGSHQGKDEGNS
jgi:hypothetical protein